jgi:hypothetical protein
MQRVVLKVLLVQITIEPQLVAESVLMHLSSGPRAVRQGYDVGTGRPPRLHATRPYVITMHNSRPVQRSSLDQSRSILVDVQRERLLLQQAPCHGGSCKQAAQHLASGAPGRLEPSTRSGSGQTRGGFSEQTHGRAGYF